MKFPLKPSDIFTALEALYDNQSGAAAVLGITRQGYSLAKRRDQIADAISIRAAVALGLPSAYLVVAMHLHTATNETRPTWSAAELSLRPRDASINQRDNDISEDRSNNQNEYIIQIMRNRRCTEAVKPPAQNQVHFLPLSPEKAAAIDLMKWTLAVRAQTLPNSPRYPYYVSRWNVLNKIAREKAEGTFAETVKDAPLIDPAWIPNALAAIAESERYHSTFPIDSPLRSSVFLSPLPLPTPEKEKEGVQAAGTNAIKRAVKKRG